MALHESSAGVPFRSDGAAGAVTAPLAGMSGVVRWAVDAQGVVGDVLLVGLPDVGYGVGHLSLGEGARVGGDGILKARPEASL